MDFEIIDEKGREIIANALSKTEYNGCDYSYAYECAWMSREPKCLRYALDDDIVYIAFSCVHMPASAGEIVFLPPLTTLDKIEKGYMRLREYAKEIDKPMKIICAPSEHVSLLDTDIFVVENNPDYAEYLYSPEDLIGLKGKKYHAKRNHIVKFKRSYQYEFREYTEADYDDVMKLFDIWQENKIDTDKDSREIYALKYMLSFYRDLGLNAAVLYVGTEIVGFSLGEVTSNNVGIVHFEKADTNYDGSYSAINNFFAEKYLSGVRVINRQEDMGIEGLRKAKQSYYPIGFQEKWLVRSVN